MLQWMGGSRRKVATSRKSTHTRQKQYFEQRKHQQQIIGSENVADAGSKHFNYYEGPRSLDVLSLNNLAATTQQQLCGDKNEVDVSQEKIKASENFAGFQLNEGMTASRNNLMEPKKLPCADKGSLNINNSSAATVRDSPSATTSAHNYSNLNKARDKLDERKMPAFSFSNTSKHGAEAEFSVLKLLGDDQSHGKSEELPSGEAHVAFSVKGLGKVWMETPVHSPGQVDSFSSPKMMASSWTYSSQNLHDDLRLGRRTMDEINFSDNGGPSELINDTWGMKDYLLNSDGFIFNGNRNADASQSQDGFFMIKENFHNGESKMEATAEDYRFGMFEDLDDRKYDVSCNEQPFYMDFDVSKSSEIKDSATCDFGLKDACLQKELQKLSASQLSDSPGPFPRNSTSVNDYNFIDFDLKRAMDFKVKASSWSFSMLGDVTDNLSLFSEESCSSAAVRNEEACSVETDLLAPKQKKRCPSKKVKYSEMKSNMKTFAKNDVPMDINEVLQDKNLLLVENNWTVPTKWKTKTRHCLGKSPEVKRNFQDEGISFSGAEYALAKTNLVPNFLHKSCIETYTAFVDRNFKTEDSKLNPFRCTKMSPDTDSSHRICAHNNLSPEPHGRNCLGKNILRQPLERLACVTNPHLLKTEKFNQDQSYCAESQNGSQFLCLSSAQEDHRDNKLSDCMKGHEKPQNEISVGKSRLTARNTESIVVRESREHCSEQEITKPETPKDSGYSEVKNVTKLSSISSAIENAPTKTRNENCNPANDYVEGKGDRKTDTSYQLMLESYVLQLLCVQKVLTESSEEKR